MKNSLHKQLDWLKKVRGGLLIVIITAVLIELSAAVQYWFAKESIQKEVERAANIELDLAGQKIRRALSNMEYITECMSWSIEKMLATPDSIPSALRVMLETNSHIQSVSVCMRENYYPDHGKYFEPICMRTPDNKIEYRDLSGPGHDYLSNQNYQQIMADGKNIWTEPYLSKASKDTPIVSFLSALYDKNGERVGCLVTDLSLGWLNEIANRQPITPSSSIMMISKKGNLMLYPMQKTKEMHLNVLIEDSTRHQSVEDMYMLMVKGESGMAKVQAHDGNTWFSFFKPVMGETGWSIAVLCPEKEIYAELKNLQWLALLMMLLGVALMSYIIWRSARNLKKLQTATLEKERIGSELRVASGIQQGMLPKNTDDSYSKISQRKDLRIYGKLVPAKEVGGDLYDYFIRDEKLFFCIGDVSGKGVPAALFMAVTRSLFHTLSAHESRPARIMEQMNQSLCEMNVDLLFVTFFIGVLDLPTGMLRYCNAGHDAPLLIDQQKDEKLTELPVEANLPLGVMSDFHYEGQKKMLQTSTTLFLYTDGLTEAKNSDEEMFRIEQAKQLAQNCPDTPKELVTSMREAVERFAGSNEQSDDLTMLAIRYLQPERTYKLERSLVIPNDLKAIPELNTFTIDVTSSLGIDMSTSLQLQLAIEEAVANVINYAYPEGVNGKVTIEAKADQEQLHFIISDSGTPYDPTNRGDVDTNLNVAERPIGGLGIHLIRELMDTINYEYRDGNNILTLSKKYKNQEL